MVSMKSVEKQLKRIKFNHIGWGRSEVRELPHILMPDEEIYEVVNGLYEGGFALLVATSFRVLLVDKKPMNYLTVEDLRFDMINEIDYSHRLMGARISISAGSKNLKFTSYNQPRLRKLITHVQHCMAEGKTKDSEHQEDQNSHLEQINQQLQAYLLAQHQHQQKLQEQMEKYQADSNMREAVKEAPQMPKPSPELADFLYAKSLLSSNNVAQPPAQPQQPVAIKPSPPKPAAVNTNDYQTSAQSSEMADLYAQGMQEVFGNSQSPARSAQPQPVAIQTQMPQPATVAADTVEIPYASGDTSTSVSQLIDLNPLKIAYSKLPMALRNRRFGRPSFHAHSQTTEPVITTQPSVPAAH